MAGAAMYVTAGASSVVTLASTVVAGAIGYISVLALLEGPSIAALLRSAIRTSNVPAGTGPDDNRV
jgi:hypothetical protein